MPRFVAKLNNPVIADRIYILDLEGPKSTKVWIEGAGRGNGIEGAWRIRCGNGVHVRLNEPLAAAALAALQAVPGYRSDMIAFQQILDLVCITRGRIAASRAETGLTQAEAAALVHAATRTWQDWEYGLRPMPASKWELWELKTAERRLLSAELKAVGVHSFKGGLPFDSAGQLMTSLVKRFNKVE